jgi:DNA polymerase-3 subunit epsilon
MTIYGRHDLTYDDKGFPRCSACGGSWKSVPSGGCPAKRAPSDLNNRPQPRALCRQCFQAPGGRDGICADCADELRRREKVAVAERCLHDRQAAIAEATDILHYRHAGIAIRVSGFSKAAELCQLAAVDDNGRVLWQSYIRPSRPVPAASTRIHGIEQRHVTRAPRFTDIVVPLFVALGGHILLADGAAYVQWVLGRAVEHGGKEGLPNAKWVCTRTLYAQFVGAWSPRAQRYRPQPLPERRMGVLAEATAVINRVRHIGDERPLKAPTAPRPAQHLDEPLDDPDGCEE